ncbi:hypothetical protein ACE6H2_020229 [Prunus campanulata]
MGLRRNNLSSSRKTLSLKTRMLLTITPFSPLTRLTGKLGAACVCIYVVGKLFSLPIYFNNIMVAIYVLIIVDFVIYGDLRDSEYKSS